MVEFASQVVTGLIAFMTIWCLTLFVVLPFGIRPEEEPGEGWDKGAPREHRIGFKLAVSAAVALASRQGSRPRVAGLVTSSCNLWQDGSEGRRTRKLSSPRCQRLFESLVHICSAWRQSSSSSLTRICVSACVRECAFVFACVRLFCVSGCLCACAAKVQAGKAPCHRLRRGRGSRVA